MWSEEYCTCWCRPGTSGKGVEASRQPVDLAVNDKPAAGAVVPGATHGQEVSISSTVTDCAERWESR